MLDFLEGKRLSEGEGFSGFGSRTKMLELEGLYRELLDDGACSEDRSRLERQHGLVTLSGVSPLGLIYCRLRDHIHRGRQGSSDPRRRCCSRIR